MPGDAVVGEVLESATLDDDGVGLQDGCIHVEQRDHIQDRAISGQPGHVDVDLVELDAKVGGGAHVEAIEDLETEAWMVAAGTFDTDGTHVGTDDLTAVGCDEDGGRTPFTTDFQDGVIGTHPCFYGFAVFFDATGGDEFGPQSELLVVGDRSTPLVLCADGLVVSTGVIRGLQCQEAHWCSRIPAPAAATPARYFAQKSQPTTMIPTGKA